jgi:glycosyltransferase involved in cell wall biosynthesis
VHLSVVVPTLNGREQLSGCLDALSTVAPEAELVVVNGPSADGTTGMVRDRADVDVLVEIADRRLSAARNAGIEHASGDVVAFVSRNLTVERGWLSALAPGLDAADVVTGPTRPAATGASDDGERPPEGTYAGRTVREFNPYNVAIRRTVLDELDGFDEYLEVGDGTDFAHRLAGAAVEVDWRPDMATRPEVGTDGGVETPGWHWRARARAYTLCKNYGPRPRILGGLLVGAVREGVGELARVLRGDGSLSDWLGGSRDALTGLGRGIVDGLAARQRDVGPRHNPNGRSMRADRSVSVYEID